MLDGDDQQVQALRAELARRRYDGRFRHAVAAAAGSGAAGDELLAEALSADLPPRQCVLLAAALGDVQGDRGREALLSALSRRGPGTRDLRCAATLALAKRGGSDVTDDLLLALRPPAHGGP